MITRGPCGECGSPLATDQRYCINCGARVGPPLAIPYATATSAEGAPAGSRFWDALPMPVQTATAAAALALGFGIVAGTAISPNLAGPLAGPVVVVQVPPAAPAPEPIVDAGSVGGGGGGGGGDPAPVASTTPTESFGGDTSDDGGGGGGGGSKNKKKKKPKKEKPTFINGTVVHNNPVAASYGVASGGSVSAIHAASLPPVGTVVRVPVRLLENRTFAEDGKRQNKGQATQASFAGVVTDARDSDDPNAPDVYTVSLRGWSILIHMPPDATPTQDQHPPALGSFATVNVEIRTPPTPPTPLPANDSPAALPCAPPPQPVFPTPAIVPAKELHQTSLVAQPSTSTSPVQIETVVQGTCPSGEALLSSDDLREGMTDILVTGSGVDVTLLTPGTSVIANVTVAGAPPQLTGVQNDAGIAGADAKAGSQGDLKLYSAASSASAEGDRAALRTERRVHRAYERAKRKLARIKRAGRS